MDDNRSGRISIDEFFGLCEIIDNTKKFSFDKMRPPLIWERFRAYMDLKFNLKENIESPVYQAVMFVITITNCALIVASLTVTDPTAIQLFDIFDKVYYAIYLAEFIGKIIALGYYDYFEDDWNKFDFILVLF